MALCAMSMNNSMIYPFAALSLGAAAFSQLVMFDMGHARAGVDGHDGGGLQVRRPCRRHPRAARRTLLAPPLWVLFISLGAQSGRRADPARLPARVLVVGQMLMLLVPLAMGLLVSARGMRRPEVITAVALRSVFGLLVGLVLVLAVRAVRHRAPPSR